MFVRENGRSAKRERSIVPEDWSTLEPIVEPVVGRDSPQVKSDSPGGGGGADSGGGGGTSSRPPPTTLAQFFFGGADCAPVGWGAAVGSLEPSTANPPLPPLREEPGSDMPGGAMPVGPRGVEPPEEPDIAVRTVGEVAGREAPEA